MTIHSNWYYEDIATIVPECAKAYSRNSVDIAKIDSKVIPLITEQIDALKAFIASDGYTRLDKIPDADTIEQTIALSEKVMGLDRVVNTLGSTIKYYYPNQPNSDARYSPWLQMVDLTKQVTGKLAKAIQQMTPQQQDALCEALPEKASQIRDIAKLNPHRTGTIVKSPAYVAALQEWNSYNHQEKPDTEKDEGYAVIATKILHAKLDEAKKAGYCDNKEQFDAENKIPAGTLETLMAADRSYLADYVAHSSKFMNICIKKNDSLKIRYSWQEAKDIVISAYTKLDPELGRLAKRIFDSGWVQSDTNNSVGGLVIPGLHPSQSDRAHPFLRIHFTGNTNEVIRLGHEMMHALHYMEINKKSIFVDYPGRLLVEGFSHFAEPLMKEEMLKRAKSPAQQNALRIQFAHQALDKISRLPNILFEEELHRTLAEHQEKDLTFADIETLHKKFRLPYAHLAKLSFWEEAGPPIVTQQKPYDEAVYIIDYLVADAMMDACKSDSEAFRKALREGLAAGDTISALQLWQNTLGPDFKLDQAFFERGLKKIDAEMQTATELLENLPTPPYTGAAVRINTTLPGGMDF